MDLRIRAEFDYDDHFVDLIILEQSPAVLTFFDYLRVRFSEWREPGIYRVGAWGITAMDVPSVDEERKILFLRGRDDSGDLWNLELRQWYYRPIIQTLSHWSRACGFSYKIEENQSRVSLETEFFARGT